MTSLYMVHDNILYPNVPGLKELDLELEYGYRVLPDDKFNELKETYTSELSNAISSNTLTSFYLGNLNQMYHRALEGKIMGLVSPPSDRFLDCMKRRTEMLENALNNLSKS